MENGFCVGESKKKTETEETYLLSDILSNGGCIRCMNKTCKINGIHGMPFSEDFPDVKAKYILDTFSKFVLNPTYINGITAMVEKEKLDLNGKKISFTMCNYVNGNCRNCYEGRIKEIKINNSDLIYLCYPPIETVRFKVTYGFHADIKIVFKGKKYDVFLIHKEDRIVETPSLEEDIKENVPIVEMWPSLLKSESSDQIKESTSSLISFNKIREIYKSESKEIIDEPKIQIIEKKEDNNNEIIEKLSYDIIDLNKKNDLLNAEILRLKYSNNRDKSIIRNNHIYQEILHNNKFIDNAVTKQFFENYYDDYEIF